MVNTKNQPLADELGCFNLFRSKWNCVVAVNSLQHRGLKCDFYSLGGFLFPLIWACFYCILRFLVSHKPCIYEVLNSVCKTLFTYPISRTFIAFSHLASLNVGVLVHGASSMEFLSVGGGGPMILCPRVFMVHMRPSTPFSVLLYQIFIFCHVFTSTRGESRIFFDPVEIYFFHSKK